MDFDKKYLQYYTLKSCPYCSSTKHHFKYDYDFTKMVECDECGTFYFFPRLSYNGLKAMLEDYERKIKNNNQVQKIVEANINLWEKDFIKLQKYLPDDSKKKYLLDIGTAEGVFLKTAKQKKYFPVGIEPIKFNNDVHNDSSNYKIINKMFEESIDEIKKINNGKFNVISVREAIYYFVDLKKFIITIKKFLLDDGLLFLKIHSPNSLSYKLNNRAYYERYGYQVQAIINKRTLKNILKNEGFEILETYNYRIVLSKFGLHKLNPALRFIIKLVLRLLYKIGFEDSYAIIARKVKTDV